MLPTYALLEDNKESLAPVLLLRATYSGETAYPDAEILYPTMLDADRAHQVADSWWLQGARLELPELATKMGEDADSDADTPDILGKYC